MGGQGDKERITLSFPPSQESPPPLRPLLATSHFPFTLYAFSSIVECQACYNNCYNNCFQDVVEEFP